MEPISLCELPPQEHPRERLAQLGAQALSDSELIAILLRADDGLELGRRLLARFRSLHAMSHCDMREIAAVPGVGMEKAAKLVAAFGLGRRMARETVAKLKVDSPEIVCQLVGQEMRALDRESLCALLLDTKHHLIRIEEVSVGGLNMSVGHPREIFKAALIHSAYAVIMVHNHPSGDPTPSEADQQLTRRLVQVGEMMQIPVLDHIIIGGMLAGEPSYYSFREEEEL